MSDTVQHIKDRLSIVDVISPYVKLTRSGKHWRGLSPFNKEKTPSFFVSPDRGLYHCFSSGKGGDMFTFIEEVENVDFRGALKILAEKAGVEIIAEAPGVKDERERTYEVLALANEFFVAQLNKTAPAKEYLESRGVSTESVRMWSLGYAPHEWRALYDYLSKKGFSEGILERAGLIKYPEQENRWQGTGGNSENSATTCNLQPATSGAKRPYDRFRGRIMFPIRDVSGRVIAFSGRIFEDDPKNPQAKYLNSPETAVFDKSRVLYGLDKAKDAIRRLNACILVEGQFDLLLAHQTGYTNAVATSGTAFTEQHAELVKRYSNNLLIAYDGDRAGIAAAGRAAALSLQFGLNAKIAKLPPDTDPADLAHANAAVFKETVKNALHVVDFYLAHIADARYDTRTHRLEVSRTVLPYVAMISNRIDQAHFVERIAEVLGVSADAVLAEVKKLPSIVQPKNIGGETASAEPFVSRADTLERLGIGLRALFEERGDKESAEEAYAVLVNALGAEKAQAIKSMSPEELRPAIFEAEIFLERQAESHAEKEILAGVYDDLLNEERHEQYRDAVRALRAAEKVNDKEKTDSLMQTLARLAGELR